MKARVEFSNIAILLKSACCEYNGMRSQCKQKDKECVHWGLQHFNSLIIMSIWYILINITYLNIIFNSSIKQISYILVSLMGIFILSISIQYRLENAFFVCISLDFLFSIHWTKKCMYFIVCEEHKITTTAVDVISVFIKGILKY